MPNLKTLIRLGLISLIPFCLAEPWRLNERKKVMEVISALKEFKCPSIVVVLDSSIESEDVDANDYLVETLIHEYLFPLTLLEISTNGFSQHLEWKSN
jgi:hypothetical protein